jgi:hypothetical protein
MAKKPEKTKATRAPQVPTFRDVQHALTKALGTPKKRRGILQYKPPASAKEVNALIKRVHAVGGAASLAEAHPARVLCVVNGPPSMLMDLVTWVSWQSKSARNALDKLNADAGLRVANIKYTKFVVELERVPKDPAAHAKRLAKIVMQGDAKKIEAALRTRRWKM